MRQVHALCHQVCMSRHVRRRRWDSRYRRSALQRMRRVRPDLPSKGNRCQEIIMKTYNVYIAGVGGQGVVKTSIIIGLACVKKGVNVVMSEIHGMAQRGGSVPAEMKIGDAYSPIIEKGGADLLISFEPAESLRAMSKLSKDTVAVVNTQPIIPVTVALGTSVYLDPKMYIDELKSKLKRVVVLDAESMAREAGNILALNMVMLGASSCLLYTSPSPRDRTRSRM